MKKKIMPAREKEKNTKQRNQTSSIKEIIEIEMKETDDNLNDKKRKKSKL